MSDTTALARMSGTYAFSLVSQGGVSPLHNHLLVLTEVCVPWGKAMEKVQAIIRGADVNGLEDSISNHCLLWIRASCCAVNSSHLITRHLAAGMQLEGNNTLSGSQLNGQKSHFKLKSFHSPQCQNAASLVCVVCSMLPYVKGTHNYEQKQR